MKTLVSKKVLSIAFAAAVLAAVGSVQASAQALSHDGSALPHYFDANGELKWGGWAPPAAEHVATNSSAGQKSANTSRSLDRVANVHHKSLRS